MEIQIEKEEIKVVNKDDAEEVENETTQADEPKSVGLLSYHPPTLRHFGGLVELVQHRTGFGRDGGNADCSHS